MQECQCPVLRSGKPCGFSIAHLPVLLCPQVVVQSLALSFSWSSCRARVLRLFAVGQSGGPPFSVVRGAQAAPEEPATWTGADVSAMSGLADLRFPGESSGVGAEGCAASVSGCAPAVPPLSGPAFPQHPGTTVEEPPTATSPMPILSFDDGLLFHSSTHSGHDPEPGSPSASPGPHAVPGTPTSSPFSLTSAVSWDPMATPHSSPSDHRHLEEWLDEVISSDSWPTTESD